MSYCIYTVENSINGKRYFGQTKNPKTRWGSHVKLAGRGKGWVLHAAIRKHGVSSFMFRLIEEGLTREQASQREMFWIEHWETFGPFGYNLTAGGESGGHRKNWNPSAETRRRMSESHKGKKLPEEQKRKIGEAGKGRVCSDEARRRISAANLGMKRTPEQKQRILEGRRKHCLNREGGVETWLLMD